MLAIRLPKNLEDRMDKLAKRTGRTKTFYARQAIVEHIGDLEDLHIAEARLADIDAGRVRTLSLEEALVRLR
jgi:RHH-type rel operon transcriptional repressor/antitoxin RelB